MVHTASVLSAAWRRIYRIVLITLWCLLILFWNVFLRFFLPDTKSRNMMRKSIRCWGRVIVKILGVNIRLNSESASPASVSGLIVANHQGTLDFIVCSAIFGPFLTAKTDIRKWPLVGMYAELAYMIWINRRSARSSLKCMTEIREYLKRGFPVIMFPEATSRDTRRGLLPFKPLFLESVVNTELLIHPFVVCYWVPDGERYPNYEVGDNILRISWQFLGNSRTECLGCLLPARSAGTLDRKTLAKSLHDEMASAFLRVWKEIDGRHSAQSEKKLK